MYPAVFRAVRRAVLHVLARVLRFVLVLRDAAWAAPDRPFEVAPKLTVRQRWAAGLAGAAVVVLLTVSADWQLRDLVPGSMSWALACLEVLPLLLVASRPLAAWRISAIGFTLTTFAEVGHAPTPFWPWPVGGCAAFAVMLFLAAQRYGRDIAVGVDVLTSAGVLLPAITLVGMGRVEFCVAAVAMTLVLVLGESIHSRREAARHLVEAEQQRRAGLARQAVLEERSRIARELHDVVAHHMSMIAIQAEAAPYKEPGLPDRTLATFAAIREASTTALTEMRRVIGLLREEDEDAERAPQPGIDRIPDMVRAARQAGMHVDLTLTGGPDRAPTVVDVSAYRIVQEALSNAGRHAPGARVEIEVVRTRRAVRLVVADDGHTDARADAIVAAAAPDGQGKGGGHGLTGMRERAALLGGTLHAAPRKNGGFVVAAELPFEQEQLPAQREEGSPSTRT